jgi:hypothetical protein
VDDFIDLDKNPRKYLLGQPQRKRAPRAQAENA